LQNAIDAFSTANKPTEPNKAGTGSTTGGAPPTKRGAYSNAPEPHPNARCGLKRTCSTTQTRTRLKHNLPHTFHSHTQPRNRATFTQQKDRATMARPHILLITAFSHQSPEATPTTVGSSLFRGSAVI